MASLLYLIVCALLTGLSVLELKTRNRTARIQLYVTLLCAMVFCGAFALLVSAAQLAGGQFQSLAAVAVLLLTAGSLYALTRTTRRFRAIQSTRSTN